MTDQLPERNWGRPMTRSDALRALLERVEAEIARTSDFMCAFPKRHEHWDEDPAAHASAAYHGSLDAAKALHEAVLPGCHFVVCNEASGFGFVSEIFDLEKDSTIASGHAQDPARAWIIAILKALIATEGN